MKLTKSFIVALDVILFLFVFTFPKSTLFLLLAFLFAGVVLIHNKYDWKIFINAMIAGFIVETVAVHLQIWTYHTSDLFSVPLWIFAMWGVLALSLYKLTHSSS